MYTDIYQGRGSGLLLLINNDTRDDYLYRTGSCLKAIPDDDDDIAFFWSTKDLVAGNYSSAILRIMQLGEKCPQYVFDNIGIFSEEEIYSLEKKLTEKKNIFLLATSNGTDKTNEDICQSYYERRSKDHNGFMVMLDTKSNTVTIVSDEKMSDELSKARASAEKLMKSGDALAAVNEIVASIG